MGVSGMGINVVNQNYKYICSLNGQLIFCSVILYDIPEGCGVWLLSQWI